MRKIILMLLFFSLTIFSYSQIDYYENPQGTKDTTKLERKMNYGFDLGLNFGYITYVGTSIQLAYPVTSYNSVGVGFNFTYYKTRGYASNIIYGAGIFDEFYILKMFIIHSEFQEINQTDFLNSSRMWNHAIYLGPGYKQSMGKKAYATYLVLWDFNYNDKSVYSNPLFRISFYF